MNQVGECPSEARMARKNFQFVNALAASDIFRHHGQIAAQGRIATRIRDSFSHGAGPEKIQAVAALPELLERAVPIPEGTKRIGQQKTKAIYAAKLRIGDKRFLAGLVVRQDANGQRFYDHELSRIEQENPGTVLPHQGAVSEESRDPWPSRGSIVKIIRQALGVKESTLVFRRGHGAAEAPASPVRGLEVLASLRGIVDIEHDATGMVATVSNTNIAKMLSLSAVGKSVSPEAQALAVGQPGQAVQNRRQARE